MTLRRVGDLPKRLCTSSEHEPPSMVVLQPGAYEHTCPRRGSKRYFTVRDSASCRVQQATNC